LAALSTADCVEAGAVSSEGVFALFAGNKKGSGGQQYYAGFMIVFII
jgi:hypothetical protein